MYGQLPATSRAFVFSDDIASDPSNPGGTPEQQRPLITRNFYTLRNARTVARTVRKPRF
jgi:hypothetical protein